MSRPKPRPSAVRAQRRSMAGLVPGPKFGTFTPRRTGVIVALPRGGRGYTGSCEQLRTTGDDAPRAGPLTRPDVPIPRPVPPAVPGPVLQRLRAVLYFGRAARRPLPGPRHVAATGGRGKLVLPAVALRRPAAG